MRHANRRQSGAQRAGNLPSGAAVRAAAPLQRSGVPRFMRINVGRAGDGVEQQAERAATRPPQGKGEAPRAQPPQRRASPIAQQAGSRGEPLDVRTRAAMAQRLGADFGHVRTHTGTQAALLARDLGADAFTHGHDVFYGAGRSPGDDALTAHELAHVAQQSGRAAPDAIRCSRNGSFPVANGGFEIDLQTREGGGNTPPTHSGLDGYIRFVPGEAAPLSNQIEMVQVVKLTDVKGADVQPGSLPADRSGRGALGDPGILTEDSPDTGVEGGFFTDVYHGGTGGGSAPAGEALSPSFNFQPAAPGTVGSVGQVKQPDAYGGGTGGVLGRTPGFKRSNDAADIRSAALYDQPGVASAAVDLDFEFESVAVAQDKGLDLAAVHWGFGIRSGKVIDEHLTVADAASATFDEAVERHREFYVHEPAVFYFDFDSAVLGAAEAARIDDFMPYLLRSTDVIVSLEGSADQVGGNSRYNTNLSLARVDAVEAALLARGLPRSRLDWISVGVGASTAATTDAGTGDQGGDAAVGADQAREANRWANRRVVVTFSRPAPVSRAP